MKRLIQRLVENWRAGSSFHRKESASEDGRRARSQSTRVCHSSASKGSSELRKEGHYRSFLHILQTRAFRESEMAKGVGNSVSRGLGPNHTSNQNTVDLLLPMVWTAPIRKRCWTLEIAFQNTDPYWEGLQVARRKLDFQYFLPIYLHNCTPKVISDGKMLNIVWLVEKNKFFLGVILIRQRMQSPQLVQEGYSIHFAARNLLAWSGATGRTCPN